MSEQIHELSKCDPYPEFRSDLQLVVSMVSACIIAAPIDAANNKDPGTFDDYREMAIYQLGLIKRDLAKMKQVIPLDKTES